MARQYTEPQRQHYHAENNRRHREFREWLQSLKTGPCADCGVEYPPVVMDWHHRDPATKEFGLNLPPRNRERVLAEIAKCDLLCANCHRLRGG